MDDIVNAGRQKPKQKTVSPEAFLPPTNGEEFIAQAMISIVQSFLVFPRLLSAKVPLEIKQ